VICFLDIANSNINFNDENMLVKKGAVNIKTSNIRSQSVIFMIGVLGIWVIVLQNFGVLPVREQKVYVINSIDTRVVNTVDANIMTGNVNAFIEGGFLEVENTVSVSIDEVLGKDNEKYYFNN